MILVQHEPSILGHRMGGCPYPPDEDGFELIDTVAIRYPLALRGPGQVANLLLMTPFFWSIDDSARARLADLDTLDTEVDVVVHAYRRTSDEPPRVE